MIKLLKRRKRRGPWTVCYHRETDGRTIRCHGIREYKAAEREARIHARRRAVDASWIWDARKNIVWESGYVGSGQ
jgi:hypothetical protein